MSFASRWLGTGVCSHLRRVVRQGNGSASLVPLSNWRTHYVCWHIEANAPGPTQGFRPMVHGPRPHGPDWAMEFFGSNLHEGLFESLRVCRNSPLVTSPYQYYICPIIYLRSRYTGSKHSRIFVDVPCDDTFQPSTLFVLSFQPWVTKCGTQSCFEVQNAFASELIFSVQKWLLTTCQLKKQLRQQNGSMESAWQALWAATQDSGLIKTNHAQQNTLVTIDRMIAVFLPRFSWYQSLWLSNLLQASAAQGQMASSSMGPAMLDTWKTMISPGFQKTP